MSSNALEAKNKKQQRPRTSRQTSDTSAQTGKNTQKTEEKVRLWSSPPLKDTISKIHSYNKCSTLCLTVAQRGGRLNFGEKLT